MNIDSLGEGKIELLYNQGLVRNASDLYHLTYDQLFGLEKVLEDEDGKSRMISFKEKTVQNILNGIGQSKGVPFERVLYAVGIRFVGEVTAKKLARHFRTVDALANASQEELMEVEDVGERVADSIILFFNRTENLQQIMDLREAGLHMEVEETAADSETAQTLAGKTVVVSGVFSVSRDEIKQIPHWPRLRRRPPNTSR